MLAKYGMEFSESVVSKDWITRSVVVPEVILEPGGLFQQPHGLLLLAPRKFQLSTRLHILVLIILAIQSWAESSSRDPFD